MRKPERAISRSWIKPKSISLNLLAAMKKKMEYLLNLFMTCSYKYHY